MSSGFNSGVTKGNQLDFENLEAEMMANANELEIKKRLEYLRNELPKSSPIQIPQNAKIKDQVKNGYIQVKYEWTQDGYMYLCRWHTHTPGAPEYSQETWVVERRKPGIGAGKGHRPSVHEVLIGEDMWIDWSIWDEAKKARRYHSETKEQRELLDNGHWKA